MRNFYKKNDIAQDVSNPFAMPAKKEKKSQIYNPVLGKRLNITDMEFLNSSDINSEIKFMEIKMDNLYRAINQKPQTLDPVSLEKLKMEWEDLRERLYKMKSQNEESQKLKKPQAVTNSIKTFLYGSSKIAMLFKMYSPKVKKILAAFDEINKEVEDLVKKATPQGEEELKYGLLVNKIYQASKLNGKLTNEIK